MRVLLILLFPLFAYPYGDVLRMSQGGTGNSTFATGGMCFSDGTKLTTDAANIFWNNTSKRLGIGTASPGTQLEINGVTRSFGYSLSGTGVTGGTTAFAAGTVSTDINWGMYFRAPTASSTIAAYSFRNIADTELMRIISTGDIGIGITPSAKLHVAGAGTTASFYTNGDAVGQTLLLSDTNGATGNGGQILFGSPFGSFAGIKGYLLNGTGPSGDLLFQTRSTTGNIVERMRVQGDGKVRLGNFGGAMASLVDIQSGTDEAVQRIWNYRNNGGTTTVFQIGDDRGFSAATTGIVADIYQNTDNSNTGTLLLARTSQLGNVLRVNSNGNVGIGITPTTKLHTYTTGADNNVRFESASGVFANNVKMINAGSDSGASFNNIVSEGVSGQQHWYVGGNGVQNQLSFKTGGTERVIISPTGAVTINDAGGNGGNVPHSCVLRTANCVGATVCQVNCAVGEKATGGGCFVSTSPLSSYPPSGPDYWYCTTAASATITPHAICCKY